MEEKAPQIFSHKVIKEQQKNCTKISRLKCEPKCHV
jgi:hypothetical protein